MYIIANWCKVNKLHFYECVCMHMHLFYDFKHSYVPGIPAPQSFWSPEYLQVRVSRQPTLTSHVSAHSEWFTIINASIDSWTDHP